MQGLSSLCIAAVVLSILAPSSALALQKDMMAQSSPSNVMVDMKYTDDSEAQDYLDENVQQAIEQEGEFNNSYVVSKKDALKWKERQL